MSRMTPEMIGQIVLKHEVHRIDLQVRMGYGWKDQGLLRQALTHSSYGHMIGEPHSERLEFLGDGVLDLVTAEWLMAQHPIGDEGFMSQCRAALVRETALAGLARRLQIDLALLVAPRDAYLRSVQSVLADAFEAVVGALYLDSGSVHMVRCAMHRCGFFDGGASQ